jgi:hypothetical protein
VRITDVLFLSPGFILQSYKVVVPNKRVMAPMLCPSFVTLRLNKTPSTIELELSEEEFDHSVGLETTFCTFSTEAGDYHRWLQEGCTLYQAYEERANQLYKAFAGIEPSPGAKFKIYYKLNEIKYNEIKQNHPLF